MNSPASTWRDRFNVEKPTIDAALKSAGFMPAGFDFVTGGTLQPGDRNKVVYNPAPNGDNNWYRWNGAFPKKIAANSQPNPKNENNWVLAHFRIGIVEKEALRRTYLEAGYNLVNGSFEQGGTLVNSNDVLLQERTGKAFSGLAGTVTAGTNPASGGFVDRSGIVLASITRVVTLAEMGIHQSLNLNNIKSTSWADCVLDFGMVPLNLTAALTLNLTNVLVRGLVLRPTTYTTLKITGTNYHFAHNDLSGINAPKDYFNKTDTELPLFIALRLEGTGFSFKHNVISEYVSRQGILVANAHDFRVSNNRVINCWSYNRISTRGLFDNYGDGIYVTDSVNGFVDDNIVENSMGNPIGRIGVCVEFNCVNIKVRGNSIQGYDRGLHVELCEDDIEFQSNNIRGCNFPLVAWNCKTAKVKFIDNTITTEGIVSSNPTHAPILLYGFRAHIMSLGDYVTEYSNNSGVEFNGNTITTVDGTNTPNLIYSENALDVKFNSNKHVRKNAGYPVITISGDVQLRTYYANLFNNEFDADLGLSHLDVMSVRHNRFNRLSLFFKSNSLLTRPGIENREITDNTYKSGTPSGGILMAGEAQSRIERNTIIMQAFDYVFPHMAAHVVSDNKFVRNDPAGFDPKLVLTLSRYAQGGNAVLLSGAGNVFIDNVLKYNFMINGSGHIVTAAHQVGPGMQILFVPFLTDTQNAYSRVKVCAHARAIENECFVVIAGSVGNLPRVHNMDIQYAQSGVFTPCDFAFPTDGKRAEATPNTEMILVSDVDLDLLNELHTYGSVRNLKDRRGDLYEVKMKR
jgi:hypothetical protein